MAPSPAPVRELTAADADRFAALLAIADGRRDDTAAVNGALARGSEPVRIEAVLVLGQNHLHDAAPRLQQAVRGRDTAVAATAAYALGLMRDSSAATMRALGDLVGVASTRAPSVGVEAACALGAIGPAGRETIVRALGSLPGAGPTIPATVETALLYAAATLRPVPVGRVAPYIGSGDVAVVRAAAYALARSRASAGTRAVLGIVAAPDADTRAYVARALSTTAAGDTLADTARRALETLLRDADPHVRIAAAETLSPYGPRERAPLLAALGDSDTNVRIAVAGVLDPVLGGVRTDWRHAFDADTTFAYRQAIVGAALRAGVVLEAIDRDNLDDWQRRSDWRYRAAAAEAAMGAAIERIRDQALPLTDDPDGRVRAAAYAALAPAVDTLPPDVHPWRREYLRGALGDPDLAVRATALMALERFASAADVPAVLRSYAIAEGDSQADARVAAIEVLASAWSRDSTDIPPVMRAAIARLPEPTDPESVAAARGSLLFAAWGTPVPAAHPASWYRGIVDSIVRPALAGRPARAVIETARGPITVELFGFEAPLTVANYIALARRGFYHATTFHRVVPAFVAQDGDPRGDGNGGPPTVIRDELNRERYARGTLGMALSGPDTGGSQYFLTLMPEPGLDGHYTVFGRVVDGWAALDRTVRDDSIADIRVLQ